MFKNKIAYSIIITLIIIIIFPCVTCANNNTSFVWSEISAPVVETVASLTR